MNRFLKMSYLKELLGLPIEIPNDQVMHVPIKKLGLSKEFNMQCKVMGFETLNDVILTGPKQLLEKNGFSYTWLGELVKYLNKRKLLHLLQPIPGKTLIN